MCMYITGHLDSVFSAEHRKEMLRYMYNHQNADGGWGLHIESHSTMFGTVFNYICIRLLGEGPDGGQDNACARARNWIHKHGGATYIPSWGKTWLSVHNFTFCFTLNSFNLTNIIDDESHVYFCQILGLYDWSGSNPMPPELWLLPSFLPVNPGHRSSFHLYNYLTNTHAIFITSYLHQKVEFEFQASQ